MCNFLSRQSCRKVHFSVILIQVFRNIYFHYQRLFASDLQSTCNISFLMGFGKIINIYSPFIIIVLLNFTKKLFFCFNKCLAILQIFWQKQNSQAQQFQNNLCFMSVYFLHRKSWFKLLLEILET